MNVSSRATRIWTCKPPLGGTEIPSTKVIQPVFSIAFFPRELLRRVVRSLVAWKRARWSLKQSSEGRVVGAVDDGSVLVRDGAGCAEIIRKQVRGGGRRSLCGIFGGESAGRVVNVEGCSKIRHLLDASTFTVVGKPGAAVA